MKTEHDLRGVAVHRIGRRLAAGPVYCPIYAVDGTQGLNPDKVLIDDPAFTADTDNEAAKIALLRLTDTRLSGLAWTRKVGVVTLQGILGLRGRVGPLEVVFYAGPTFDRARHKDDKTADSRRRAGLPTGLPGDRRIKVASRDEL
jgi:hypothetical protein